MSNRVILRSDPVEGRVPSRNRSQNPDPIQLFPTHHHHPFHIRHSSCSLNSIPSLAVEDKPGTEAFKRYVTEVMDTNWKLLPMLLDYVQEDKFAASDLVSRIERKEIRTLADFALGDTALDELAVRPLTVKQRDKIYRMRPTGSGNSENPKRSICFPTATHRAA